MWARILEFFISRVVFKLIEQIAIILPKMLIDWAAKKKQEKEIQEAKEAYEKIKETEGANEDEISKKHQDYINSGHRN
jgi:hypothetical protein